MPSRRPLIERFLEKVTYEPNTGCWLWLGAILPNGYGHISPGGDSKVNGTIYAHRASMMLFKNSDLIGLDVCHTCDNRCCVNPDHLFVGSRKDNMRDCVAKDRQQRGERHCRAKITDQDVFDIRTGRMSKHDFAKLYGITHRNVRHIQLGRTWRHLCASPVQRDNGK